MIHHFSLISWHENPKIFTFTRSCSGDLGRVQGHCSRWQKNRATSSSERQDKANKPPGGIKREWSCIRPSPPLSVGVCSTSLAFSVLSGTPESGHRVQFPHRKHPVEPQLRLTRCLCICLCLRAFLALSGSLSSVPCRSRGRPGDGPEVTPTHTAAAWHIVAGSCRGAASGDPSRI